jgi:Transcriptional regulators
MSQKVNIKDLALKTGLSITTVSRVLNGKAEQYRIGKKSQEKIRAAADDLNYTPNQFAVNLKSGRSRTVALVIPSLNNPFFAKIACNINQEIRKFGYITIIIDSDENPEIEKTELRQLVSRNIEGLIIVPCGDNGRHLQKLHEQGLPVVCIDRYFEDLDISYVSTDNYYGAFAATNLLIENGHKSIACLQGVQQSIPNRLRVKGYIDAMNKAGLYETDIAGDDFTVQNGYLETKLLLQKKNRPTAIFSLSNTIAMGCMKAFKEENINVPGDISLITFDDHPYLDYLSTPLSCIAQPVADISKIAVKFLFAKIENNDIPTKQILIKPKIKLKDSVKTIQTLN